MNMNGLALENRSAGPDVSIQGRVKSYGLPEQSPK